MRHLSLVERSALAKYAGGPRAIRALPLVERLRHGIEIAMEIRKEKAAVKCVGLLKLEKARQKQLQEERQAKEKKPHEEKKPQEEKKSHEDDYDRHKDYSFTRIIKGRDGKEIEHTFGCSHDMPLF